LFICIQKAFLYNQSQNLAVIKIHIISNQIAI